MATTKFGDLTAHTNGELPAVGSKLPAFTLTGNDLTEFSSEQFAGKKIILNIFPSIDTGVCSASVREFNQRATTVSNVAVICVSKDLPFAMKRFCGGEGVEHVTTATDFRDLGFAKNYGVLLTDSKFKDLFARAVVVADENGVVRYTELVPAIGQEPNYDAAFAAL
jgi:thiol peroxidase